METKKYLTIGEMAAELGMSVEALRKWEGDFPGVIRPKRTRGGTRLYDRRAQERVWMVHRLLHKEGLSVEGARRRLTSRQTDEEVKQEVIARLMDVRTALAAMADELKTIKQKQEEPQWKTMHE